MRPTAAPPSRTLYHRWFGWYAPVLRRATTVLAVGVTVALALLVVVPWQLAALVGWDAGAAVFLANVWPLILRSDGEATRRQAVAEDDTRTTGSALLISVCLTSLLGVGLVLKLAGGETGLARALLVAGAVATVVLSWTVLNTMYVLRYAHLYYGSAPDGMVFNGLDHSGLPAYRDFAYVAFTIGMTYQVSDTTLRDMRFRRTVLVHALLAYLFGVVIIAGVINVIASLLR